MCIKEMYIKTTRCHSIPTESVILKMMYSIASVGEDGGQVDTYTLLMGMQNGIQPFWKRA